MKQFCARRDIMPLVLEAEEVFADSDNFHVPETEDMGSFNHSYLQMKLGAFFLAMPDYIALTELSLDSATVQAEYPNVGQSIVPDVAVYPARQINLAKDTLKMTEMPLLVIEILSPMQAPQLLVDKVAIYFALGIRSCWIVYPTSQTISVFHAPYQPRSFSAGEVIDEVMGIKVSIEEIFA
ncbi:MAG: Uma2 family endonuclease [Caldilineaceae bacterium]|nr:Uma2 family endonuclease [Caldilineaceae bacterium]